jgi:hypothetical protein
MTKQDTKVTIFFCIRAIKTFILNYTQDGTIRYEKGSLTETDLHLNFNIF